MAFTNFSRTLAVKVESDGVGGFTESMDSAVATLGKFKYAVGLAGGALAAFGGVALASAANAAADFEEAMVEVQKVTDAQTAAAMNDEIMEMARTIPLAQGELATLAADAARFGVRGPKNIRTFTEAVAKMATATDLSTQEAGESLAKLSTLTGTPVGEIENLGSAVNELSNNFATSSSEIVDSMMRGSAALTQLGVSTTDIVGLSASLNEVSESSERAGTRLRRLAQEMMEPKKVADLAGAMGMTVEEFKTMRKNDPTGLIVQMAEAMKQGGDQADALRSTLSTTSRQALAGLAQNLDGVRNGLEMANESFEKGTSLQKEFDAATDTFNSRMTIMKNLLRENAIQIGNVLLPPLTRLLKSVNRFLKSSDSLLGQLSAQQKAWGLVGMTIGGVALAIAAFVSGPVGLAILAAGALATAWTKNLGNIRGRTARDLGAIRSTFQKIFAILLPQIRANLAILRKFWKQNGAGIVADVKWALTQVLGVVRSVMTFLVQNLWIPLLKRFSSVTSGRLGGVLSEFQKTFEFIMAGAKQFAAAFNVFWKMFGDEITAVAKFALDALVGIFGTAMDAIITSLEIVLAMFRGDWRTALEKAAGFYKRTFGGLRDFVEKWGSKLVGFFADLGRRLGSAMKNALNDAIPDSIPLPSASVGGHTIGGGSIGIPQLAEGGVVTGPTLAMIGEAGPEAVVPLDKAGAMGGGPSIGKVVVQASTRAEGEAAAQGFTDELRSAGFRW